MHRASSQAKRKDKIAMNPIKWFKGFKGFLHEVVQELKKCSWPSGPELRESTWVVIIAFLICGAWVGLDDFVFQTLVKMDGGARLSAFLPLIQECFMSKQWFVVHAPLRSGNERVQKYGSPVGAGRGQRSDRPDSRALPKRFPNRRSPARSAL